MARPKAPCGTYAAYRRHLREKTAVCESCRDAKRANSKARSGSAAARVEKQIAQEAEKVEEVIDSAGSDAVDDEPAELSRIELLSEMLEESRALIRALLRTDPSRVYLQMREQREILREIDEIKQQRESKKEATIGDQLAAARAARLEREALREAGA